MMRRLRRSEARRSTKLIHAFKVYFTENQKELLQAIPESIGNAPGYCRYAPTKGVTTLEHSEEECDRFKAGTPKPQEDPNKPKIPRPRIEDFIEEYLGNKSDKI